MIFKKNIFQLLKYNIKTLVLFEALFQTVILLMFIVISVRGFNLTLQYTDYYYLSLENLNCVVHSKQAFLYFLFMIIFFIIVETYHSVVLIILFDSSYQKEKMKLKDTFLIANIKMLQLFNIKNIIYFSLFLFIIIYFKFNYNQNLFDHIINYYVNYTSLFYITIFFLIIILIKIKYRFHYILLEDVKPNKALKKSLKLTKYYYFEDIIYFFGIFLFIFILFFIIYSFTYRYLNSAYVMKNFNITTIWCIILFVLSFFLNLSKIIYYVAISTLFYKRKMERGEIIDINTYEDITNHKYYKYFCCGLLLIVFIMTIKSLKFTYQIVQGNIKFLTEYVNKIEVTAHRGASHDYPENTMSAFKGAKKLGADWIELDVQQTKDGHIVVLHDDKFTRVAGVNKSPSEVPYHVIKRYDVGRYFDEKFDGERVPLLEDVVKYAKKNHMKLNIELKPYDNNDQFEKNVLDIIHTYHFEKRCILSSLFYESLEKVKDLDENIETLYITFGVKEEFLNANYIDNFNLEEHAVNQELVDNLHDKHKKIVVWTVDSEDEVQKMIDFGVDNIITDDVSLVKQKLLENESNSRAKESKWIKKIFY